MDISAGASTNGALISGGAGVSGYGVGVEQAANDPLLDRVQLNHGHRVIVGVGLDAGEAVPTEGGYRGRALNVAARLCSLAGPGEVLASETVAALAGRDGLVGFNARKPVRVKGIDDMSTGRSHVASWDEAMPEYRSRWQERYGSSGRWEDFEPGYRYGYEMANDARYMDRDWNDLEPEFRKDYSEWSRKNGYRSEASTWNKVKANAREAWDEARMKVRGR